MSAYTVIIPARYGSSRLPGKPLLELAGKAMIVHVIERAQASGASEVVVATDDARIESVARTAGAEVVMTHDNHPSGTDRIAEVIQTLALAEDEIIVNVQGDEPDMPPELIRQMAEALGQQAALNICTACTPMGDPVQISDPNIVKVVRDSNDNALYFSRAPIAFDRDGNQQHFSYRRHLGIYGYRAGYVVAFSSTPPCALEKTEKLEQLRALYHGERIYCPDAIAAPGIGIDTPADIERARAQFMS